MSIRSIVLFGMVETPWQVESLLMLWSTASNFWWKFQFCFAWSNAEAVKDSGSSPWDTVTPRALATLAKCCAGQREGFVYKHSWYARPQAIKRVKPNKHLIQPTVLHGMAAPTNTLKGLKVFWDEKNRSSNHSQLINPPSKLNNSTNPLNLSTPSTQPSKKSHACHKAPWAQCLRNSFTSKSLTSKTWWQIGSYDSYGWFDDQGC